MENVGGAGIKQGDLIDFSTQDKSVLCQTAVNGSIKITILAPRVDIISTSAKMDISVELRCR